MINSTRPSPSGTERQKLDASRFRFDHYLVEDPRRRFTVPFTAGRLESGQHHRQPFRAKLAGARFEPVGRRLKGLQLTGSGRFSKTFDFVGKFVGEHRDDSCQGISAAHLVGE